MTTTRKIRGNLNVLLYVYSAKANKKSMNLSVSEIIYEFYITRRIHLQKSGSSNQIFLYIPHGQLTLYQIWLCWHYFSCSGPKSHWNIFSWGPLEIGPTIPNSIVHGCRKVWKSGWAVETWEPKIWEWGEYCPHFLTPCFQNSWIQAVPG